MALPADAKPDLFHSLVACDQSLFLLSTPKTATILVIEKRTSSVTVLSLRGIQPATTEPMSLAIDCRGHVLYVVDRVAGISAISTQTGRLVRTYQLPPAFAPYPAGSAYVTAGGKALVVAGAWLRPTPTAFFEGPLRQAFAHADLGLKLSLESGATEPLFGGAGTECLATYAVCGRTPFDRRLKGWVLGEGQATTLRYTDEDGIVDHDIRVSSPQFKQAAVPVASPRSPSERQAWEETNSTVRRVFVFGDVVALAHDRVLYGASGGAPQFDAFLAIVSSTGALRAEVALPDVPVGRDETGVFVIDYGPGGRRVDARSFTILKYDVHALASRRAP